MPVCGKCHRDAQAGALFCPFCGSPIVPDAGGEASDPFIGKTFRGTYFVQRKVGEGGMGVVYQAMHVALDIPVALKILRRALLSDPAVVQRFHREARAASRLRHPQVVAVTDFGQTEDGALFMAMEYIAGRSLARLIAEEYPLPEERVVRIGAQILAALEEAHAGQVLHRDLKPENVMVEARRDEPDAVKVLDFGIAKIQLPGDGQGTLTQAGLVCGTPGYMSPEQWGGQPLDARSDLYSLGVTLYEMLTGKLPFETSTPLEMVRRHLTERPLPPSQRCPGRTYSPALEELVMRTIAVDREVRPASATALRAELLACPLLGHEPAQDPAAPPRTVVLERDPSAPPSGSRPGSPGAGAPRLTPPAPSNLPRAPSSPPRPTTPERTPMPAHAPVVRGTSRGEEAPTGRPRRGRALAALAVLVVTAALGAAALLLRSPASPPASAATAAPPVALPPPSATPPPPPQPVAGPASALARGDPTPVTAGPPEPGAGSAAPAEAETEADSSLPRPRAAPRPRVLVRDALNAIPTPAAASGQGVLSVQAEPFGEVFLDGRHYGTAPREFRVPAGHYRVRVAHPELGRRERRLEVRAGERARWVADFLAR